MNILVVDDNHEITELLRNVLEKTAHTVYIAHSGEQALEHMQQYNIHIAIVDWMMPIMNGLEVVERIRSEYNDPYVYIIMMTAKSSPEDRLIGLESGVDEYLQKPTSPRELLARLKIAERIVQHDLHRRESLDEMEDLATSDQLTGVYTRARFLASVTEMTQNREAFGRALALLMIDLDHFHKVSERYGVPVGDGVLREVAHRLQKHLRATDAIGRFGGEEFVIALPNCDLPNAIAIAERLRAAIEERPCVVQEVEIPITVSIGIGITDKVIPAEELVERANKALHLAKTGGRNLVRYYIHGTLH